MIRLPQGDYSPIDTGLWNGNDSLNRFLASQYFAPGQPSDLLGYRYDLFNGNIGAMVTSVTNPQLKTAMPLGNSYQYDQLHRIIQSTSFDELIPLSNVWNNENLYYASVGTPINLGYLNKFSYDANGNILSQLRQDMAGKTFDNLFYNYNVQNGVKLQNRLYNVRDTIGASVANGDVDDEGAFNSTLANINTSNNYRYDGIGNLIKDSLAGIATIDWTIYGKIKSITHRTGYMQIANRDTTYPPDLCFNYDAQGTRISKVVKPRTALGLKASSYWTSEYYVRDVKGNIQSVYTKHDSTEISTYYL